MGNRSSYRRLWWVRYASFTNCYPVYWVVGAMAIVAIAVWFAGGFAYEFLSGVIQYRHRESWGELAQGVFCGILFAAVALGLAGLELLSLLRLGARYPLYEELAHQFRNHQPELWRKAKAGYKRWRAVRSGKVVEFHQPHPRH
jgi:hypothetical protein